jgi:peptidoglycan/xylan/chitin deacetylase (PgdA/CDA1 family)
MLWKTAARTALHRMGGLAALRYRHRREFGVLMFHAFREEDRENIDAICSYIAQHFEPVSLSGIVAAREQGTRLPDNAITVTVDDGYHNFLLHGHPIFRKYQIPVTIYAVAGFSAGQLWLWPDQIEFGLLHTPKTSIRVELNSNQPVEYLLSSPQLKTRAVTLLTEALTVVPNPVRLKFMSEFSHLCGVEIPRTPPPVYSALNWEELRALHREGVEIGCHTETHPILSRLSSPAELDREIRGAKELLETSLRFPVRHFCYPNGLAIDMGEAAIECARKAGFASAVTCLWGFNTTAVDPMQIRRLPFDSMTEFRYSTEILAGLHLNRPTSTV